MVAGGCRERVIGILLDELSAERDDVIVAGRDGITVEQGEHHIGSLRVGGLGAGEFTGSPDQAEDPLVLRVVIDQLQHHIRSLRRRVCGLLEFGFQPDCRVVLSVQETQAKQEDEGKLGADHFQGAAFFSASTIFLASGAIALSG